MAHGLVRASILGIRVSHGVFKASLLGFRVVTCSGYCRKSFRLKT